MLLPPLNVLETWPTPNYIDPITRGPGLLIVNVVFSALALTIVALRLYTRTWITRSVGVDDVFVLIALVSRFKYESVPKQLTVLMKTRMLAFCHCYVYSHIYCEPIIRLEPPRLGCSTGVVSHRE